MDISILIFGTVFAAIVQNKNDQTIETGEPGGYKIDLRSGEYSKN